MSHQVVYRKYRSQSFEELIGQEHIAVTLSNEVKKNEIGHAYLFFGPRGCGKTSTARIFAKLVNCEKPIEREGVLLPCNECESCTNFNTDELDIIEMDAASNRGIDDARLLREKVYSQPLSHKFKVIILDEAHMLTREAVNSLLKVIEEPPSYVIFIFCTTEFHKIPITISSRCQRFKFLLASQSDLIKKLEYICDLEKKPIPIEKLEIVAKLSKGSFRDAESLLEQILSSGKDSQLDDLFAMYMDDSKSSVFIKLILDNDMEKLWEFLQEYEDIQGDVKQLLDAVLDRSQEMYKESKMTFTDYIRFINIVGGFRLGGKEELMYLLTNKNSSNEALHSIQQSSDSIANSSENVGLEKEKIIKREETKSLIPQDKNVNVQTNETASSIPVQEKKSSNSLLASTNIKDKVLNLFKEKVGIYSIIEKSQIKEDGKNLTIIVASTVSKIYLQKNKIAGIILEGIKELTSCDIEVAKTGEVKENRVSEKKAENKTDNNKSDSLNEAEKIFGSKFI